MTMESVQAANRRAGSCVVNGWIRGSGELARRNHELEVQRPSRRRLPTRDSKTANGSDTEWDPKDSDSDDLGVLPTHEDEPDNQKIKEKYNTVVELAHNLDEALFKQIAFEKKLFSGLKKFPAASDLATQMGKTVEPCKMDPRRLTKGDRGR